MASNPPLRQGIYPSTRRRALFVMGLCLALGGGLQSQGLDPRQASADMSLDELGKVPAIVSSKFASHLFEAPTGSFVFDEHSIANLPVDSIPEMLRYAPGVHIIRPSNGVWGIGMRGINSNFFNRVQFTVDEQNVYSTIFAGLFGSQHDLLMDDVASVEVAYGPGGGTWDNNAVNGMVNVLMKTAFETESSVLRARVGTESRGVAGRVGWAINNKTSARVYAKADMRDTSETRFDYDNRWETARVGFRLDHRASSRDLLSVSGEAFYSHLGYAYDLADFSSGELNFTADAEMLRGANAQLKWTRNNADLSSYSLRSWLAYSDLDAPYAAFGMLTGGVEARGSINVAPAHGLSFNLGGAYDQEHTRSTLAADFTNRFLSNFAAYSGIQHEWAIVPERLKLSWGFDYRYEDKSRLDTLSPNARLLIHLSPEDRVWFSYSQSNRTTPVSLSVIESLRSGKAIDPPISIPTPNGNFLLDRNLSNAVSKTELDPETLDAFEAGYRKYFAGQRGSVWINAFYYRYEDIFARIGTSGTPELAVERPYLNVQLTYDNLLRGEAYGFEARAQWELSPATQISASYSRLVDSFESTVNSANPFIRDSIQFSLDEFDNSSPGHMATVNLSTDFRQDWNLNAGLRYASAFDFAKGRQPSVFQLDTRLSWQKTETLRLSLVGRNLLSPTTQEARLKDFFGHWTEMKRELYLEVRADF